MRILIYFFLFVPTLIFAQGRNEKVRSLNTIVKLMNEASRLNRAWYYNAVQFSNAIYESKQKVNANYFYIYGKRLVYYPSVKGAYRFKELKPDEKNYIPGYVADLLPYLELKVLVLDWVKKPHANFYKSIDSAVLNYISKTDSLWCVHKQLLDYIEAKIYFTDSGFTTAKKLVKQNEIWFENCHQASEELYVELEAFYLKELPLDKNHQAIQNAAKEMHLTINLIDKWQKQLYNGNTLQNKIYDSTMRSLNAIGLSKDSFYLYKTKGYGRANSGWWAHTRYRTFYTSMNSTIYWYITTQYDKKPYLKKEHQYYNEFISRFDNCIDNYNEFIELTDGKAMIETSSCCLAHSEIDTSQNVMLLKPRLLHRFAYIETDNIISPSASTLSIKKSNIVNDTNVNEIDLALINSALPHHLIYLLDASSSMNEFKRLENLKENSKYLVKLQREVDKISIVSFASKAHVILKNNSCNLKTEINSKIDLIQANGSTNVIEGLQTAAHIADSCKLKNGLTKILLITDGLFKLDKQTIKLLQSFNNKQILFCIIYIGNSQSKVLEDDFKKLCKKVNGRFYNTNTINLKEALVKEASE